MADKPKESDVRKKTALETGLYNKPSKSGDESVPSAEFLAKIEEQINLRIDGAVGTLAEGAAELLKLASAKDKDAFTATEEAFQMDIRVQNMIKSAQSLLSISHALKTMHLLNSEDECLKTRQEVQEKLRAEMQGDKTDAAALVEQLIAQATSI